jgi:ATP-dependent exoDNAse (exonuclease V) alpha subunit
MHEYPIEDVHRLLDGLDSLISKLRSPGPESIRVGHLPELFETIHELDGWRNTTYLQTQVGISGALLNKFLKLRGTIRRVDTLKVADRLRSHLKSYDQPFDATRVKPEKNKPSERPKPRQKTVDALAVLGERWIIVSESTETRMKIAAIASLLDTIIKQASRSNAPAEDQFLTQIERQQLIAILETALVSYAPPWSSAVYLKRHKVCCDELRRVR